MPTLPAPSPSDRAAAAPAAPVRTWPVMLAVAALLGGCAAVPPAGKPDAAKAPVGTPAAAPAPAPAAAPTRPTTPGGLPTGGGPRVGGSGAGSGGPAGLAAGAAGPPGSSPASTLGAPGSLSLGGPAPPSAPPFSVVTRDAKRTDGPIAFWQKDDKVWLELKPEQFNKPYLLSPKIKSGIGEAFVLGGLMAYPVNGAGGPQLIEFVRVHNTVRLQARNTDFIATPGTPEARAVADAYSHSLIAATPVASLPHPDSKAVLVEANTLFLQDMLGIGMMLQRGLRQGYGLDRTNSTISAVRHSGETLVIETTNHFYTPSVGIASPLAPPGAPVPQIPRFLPDSRSLLVGLHYSIAPLPEKPMAQRLADPRLGLFTTTLVDFSNDLQLNPRRRVINRWRLEKKDPAAEMSEPVKPITFWIDRNVPHVYRPTVREAILEWNQAFEKIGFKDAIKVEQQPDDATWDTLDHGIASVRWMMNADPVFGAIGPSHVDPRSGEILDADIAFEGMSARSVRGLRSQVLAGGTAADAHAAATAGPLDPAAAGNRSGVPASFAAPFRVPGVEGLEGIVGGMPPGAHFDHRFCQHASLAAEQLGYALDILEARGELAPDSPEAERFVLDYVKDSIMHEVGHALGLRHNFRASRIYTEAQLSDPEFTRVNGTTGSVMEYNALNLPGPGQPQGPAFMTRLGPYDFWAVEYAYKPLPPGATAEQEREALRTIAARNSEPQLAYGTDEDAWFGIDPETIQLDLGSDPVAFAAKRIAIARDLFRRQETRQLSPERDYAVLRRSLGYALSDVTRAVGVLVRQIGGVRTLRDFPGSGRDPLVPLAADVQRQSLDLIASAVLAPDGLALSAPLQRRLAPDYLERAELALATDYSVPQRLFELQRAVLGYLMSEPIAARILDSVGKFDRPAEAFQLRELYGRLQQDVWNELAPEKAGKGSARQLSILPARRELQREHINRLAFSVLRPAARADARGVIREQARTLLVRLDTAARLPGADTDTRAHLTDSADTLRRALAAPLPRLGL